MNKIAAVAIGTILLLTTGFIYAHAKTTQIKAADGTLITVNLPDVTPDKAQAAVDRAHMGGDNGGGPSKSAVKPLLMQDLTTASATFPAVPWCAATMLGLQRDGTFLVFGMVANRYPDAQQSYMDFQVVDKGKGLPVAVSISPEAAANGGQLTLVYDGAQINVKVPVGQGTLFWAAADGSLYLDLELTQKAQ